MLLWLAIGRINEGKTGVTVASIDRNELREDHLRKVRALARDLEYYIPDAAWDNSKFEWIVLHQIPPKAVVRRGYINWFAAHCHLNFRLLIIP